MNYFILEFDPDIEVILNEKIPDECSGISMNLGLNYEHLPPITLTVKDANLPDCIPNHQRYLYFNSKMMQTIQEFGFNDFQCFDLNIQDQSGQKIETSHQLINITKVISCIDREKSKLDLDEDEDDEDLNIRDILQLHIDERKTENSLIFHLGGFETLLLFREDLAKTIVNAGITGIQFIPATGYRV